MAKKAKKHKKTGRNSKKKDFGRVFDDVVVLKRILVISGAGVLLFVFGLIFFMIQLRGDAQGVTISLEQNTDQITRGVPFELGVNVENKIGVDAERVELLIQISSGLVTIEDQQDEKSVIRENLDSVVDSSLVQRSFTILPTSPAGSEEKINATLTYFIGNTRFEKKSSSNITVDKEGLELVVLQPEQIVEGSAVEVTVRYKNLSSASFQNLSLDLNYPNSFSYLSSSITPDDFGSNWELGELRSGSEGELKIRGIFEGDNSATSIYAVVRTNLIHGSYVVAETSGEFKPSESPIGLDISFMGAPRIGEHINYTLTYSNRSGIALKNVKISADLESELFDFSTLLSGGMFNSQTHQITWDSNTNPELANLEPGKRGSVSVAIRLKESFPITRLNDKNYALSLNAKIETPSVPFYLKADKTSSFSSIQTKIQGLISVDAEAFYRDAASGIANSGYLPPQVGKITQYTIHWKIRNYSTDISNVVLRAPLPREVAWSGIVKSNIDSVPLYEEAAHEVVWEIKDISATRGVISLPVEGIFQIAAVPTSGMIGAYQSLLGQTTIEASDNFVNTQLKNSDGPLNTSLLDDPTVGASSGIVIE